MANTKKEPLLHIKKRDGITLKYAIWVRVIAILAAFLLCGILTVIITGINPLAVYRSMFVGAFGSVRKIWVTLQNTSILLLIALALTPAFIMRFWNIGGEGQVMAGALAAATCMICLNGKIPNALIIALEIVTSIVAGALWALIPAICKAKWNTNETLMTLMMNYIAVQLASFFIIIWEVPKGSGSIGIINQETRNAWLLQLFGSKYLLSIVVASLTMVAMFIYQKYSKHGFEAKVVGESEYTAKYAGISVTRVIIRTMLLSGALCGIAGMILVAGINHTLTINLVGGRGFIAVLVSWMSKFNPFIMGLCSFLIVFLQRGAGEIATKFGLNQSFSDILTGIILFFIIGCEFFIRYEIKLNRKGGKS